MKKRKKFLDYSKEEALKYIKATGVLWIVLGIILLIENVILIIRFKEFFFLDWIIIIISLFFAGLIFNSVRILSKSK